jgi:hypothetical protein
MANDVFEFVWTVPDEGFRWTEARVLGNDRKPSVATNRSRIDDLTQSVLTDGLTPGSGYFMKRYPPLKMYTGLFRTFAQLPIEDQGAILKFANEFGNLGVGVPLNLAAADDPNRLLGVWGETHAEWMRQIDAMHQALAIWDMFRVRDEAGLRHFIRWQDAQFSEDGRTPTRAEGWVYSRYRGNPNSKASLRRPLLSSWWTSQLIQPVQDLFTKTDVFMPALFLVQRWVNQQLEHHVSPRLLYHLDLRKEVVRIVPKNLLGAMWLQLAEAIDGRKDYRTCKECGRWFEISSRQSEHRTARRLFCTEPCKSRDYRRRKDRALELKAKGESLKDIAKDVGTEIATVKRWLTNRKT